MAKKLILIRHAKSDWENPNIRDFDRPLNGRGNVNAPEMAQRMISQKIYPELIVSSPALRALTTAKYFAKEWKIDFELIQTDKNIYEADLKTLLNVVNHFDNQHNILKIKNYLVRIVFISNVAKPGDKSTSSLHSLIVLRN